MAEPHEYIDFGSDVTSVFDTCVKTGTIDDIDYSARTATVDIGGVKYLSVPIFYHCDGMQDTDSGASAFSKGDSVIVLVKNARDEHLADQYTVVGFSSGPKTCCWENFGKSLCGLHTWKVESYYQRVYDKKYVTCPETSNASTSGCAISQPERTWLCSEKDVYQPYAACPPAGPWVEEDGKFKFLIDCSEAPWESVDGEYYTFHKVFISWSSSSGDPAITSDQKYLRLKMDYQVSAPNADLNTYISMWIGPKVGIRSFLNSICWEYEDLWFPGFSRPGRFSADIDVLIDLDTLADENPVTTSTWIGSSTINFLFSVQHGGYIKLNVDCIDFLTEDEI